MTQALAGKHALVTGGGRGIGAAIARALAAEGARVTLLGRTKAQLAETAASIPGGAATITADVTDPEQVGRALLEARAAPARSRSWSTTRAGPRAARSRRAMNISGATCSRSTSTASIT